MSSKLTGYESQDQQVTVNFVDSKLELFVITPTIVRIFKNRGRSDNSYAIDGDKTQKTPYEVIKADNGIKLQTDNLTLKIDGDEKIDVYDAKGNPLVLDYRQSREPLPTDMDAEHRKTVGAEGHDVGDLNHGESNYYEVIKALSADEQFYGLGDKTGFLNKRGYEYGNWNSDVPQVHTEAMTKLYKTIPVLYGIKNNHPYGLFFDNTYKSHFDIGKESDAYYFYSAVDGNLDYYILGGDSLQEVVANYTYLTGRVPLPQKWLLGYQQSRWGYSVSDQRVREIADGFAKYDLPLDVIHLDIDYMTGYRDFTWDESKYADPKAFVAEMGRRGIRLMPILDAGVKKDDDYDIYKEGIEKDYFAKSPDGRAYVNQVWPGDAVFPDFARKEVRDWWAKHIKFYTDLGACGIWNDMNEPASFKGPLPDDIVFHNGEEVSDHRRMHNVFGHNMARAAYDGLKAATGKRPYVITRAAYSGTQKYSTVWTGDNQSLWSHLQMAIPQLSNLGLSGFAFAGTDIGGFQANTTAELLTRWLEASLFVPLFRNHAQMGVRYQEPWSFGEPTLSIYRKFLKLRYRFVPYLYDQFYQETQNGLPVMRPLVLNDDQDPKVRNINDEYMVGDTILVAPIVEQGADKRLVYLPAGDWIDFNSQAEYGGHTMIIVDAPIDTLPIFIKKNTILPWGQAVKHISDQPDRFMTFRLLGSQASYDHYQDDGLDFNYQHGEYNLYHVAIDANQQITINLTKHGYPATYEKIFIESNHDCIEFDFDQQNQTYIRQ
ncbi:glycoside hydrolase family 31 protein [Oenococcus sicerae]|uniref:glycoside hydrolase family 31 protein n=1 Tax=Oenococcus sicerae TaxID=2203724 RepID=UPI0039ECC980